MITPEKARLIKRDLLYLELVYELYRAPDAPEWDEIKPRAETYLVHLYSRDEKGLST